MAERAVVAPRRPPAGVARAAEPGPRRLPFGLGRLELALLVLVLTLAGVVRSWNLALSPLWVDEAESCLNALAILDRGLPYGEALGLPVYENTLTEPWPESLEYEFKDSSYSASGLAVYHQWLPLYAIAAAYALAGVEPDRVPPILEVQHSVEEIRLRTWVARVPSVLFGLATLVLFFVAGRLMYGREAAFGALLAGSFARPCIVVSRQARYYSATVALTTLAAIAIWLLVRHGRRRDFALATVAFVLLFHTHLLSFAVGAAVLLAFAPRILRSREAWRRSAVSAAVVLAATLPWLLATGFLDQASGVPKGWTMLDLPRDLWIYPSSKLPFLAIAVPGFCALVAARLLARRLPPSFVRAWTADRGAGFLLAAWIAIAWAAFTLGMPAASLFTQRTTMPLAGPAILFGALVLAAFARWLHARSAVVVGPVLSLGLALALSGQGWDWMRGQTTSHQAYGGVEALRELGPFAPGTRFYATPNEHLPLTLYTGLPVQSVAPVRKSFLDAYPGEIVLIETLPRYEPIGPRRVRALADEDGILLDERDAGALQRRLSIELVRRDVARIARSVEPGPPVLEPFMERVLAEQRAANPAAIRRAKDPELDNPAVFRGFELETWLDWWPVFFYRFVGPRERMGENLNYRERARGAHAVVLPTTWVVYRIPALGAGREDALPR